MAKLSRATLKTLFSAGTSPTEDHFADLIESSVNVLDDAGTTDINKQVQIHSNADQDDRVIRMYHGAEDIEADSSDWDVRLDKQPGFDIATLLFLAGDKQQFAPEDGASEQQQPNEAVLALSSGSKNNPGNKVGINTQTPQHELDVNGVIRASGRIGQSPVGDPKRLARICADGDWHTLNEASEKSMGFELIAKVEAQPGQTEAMLHAIALFNPSSFEQLEQQLQDQSSEAPKRRWWHKLTGTEPKAQTKTEPSLTQVNTDNSEQTSSVGITVTHAGPDKNNQLQLRWLKRADGRVRLQIRSPKLIEKQPPIRCFLTQLWFE